jgi:hypothetical protein
MTTTPKRSHVRQPQVVRRVSQGITHTSLAVVLTLASTCLMAQTGASQAAPHTPGPPSHRAVAPHPASGNRASDAPATASTSTPSANPSATAERPPLPRLVAITPPDNDDDIARFALYAARDIEQLGLQFPAQTANAAPDTEVVITMRLRDGATSRMRDFSRQHMNEPMTLIVDGVEMLTATIRSELGGKFQLQLPKEKARLLFQRVLAKAGPAT